MERLQSTPVGPDGTYPASQIYSRTVHSTHPYPRNLFELHELHNRLVRILSIYVVLN
jgi:hypothetical protein